MIDHNALWRQFQTMFPDFAEHAKQYRPIGHSAISIDFGDWSRSKVFCYFNDNAWHFGTKLWWNRPDSNKTNVVKVVSESDVILQVVPDEEDNPKELGLMELVPEEDNLLRKTEDETAVEGKNYYANILTD